jgi:WD40 repeat protein
MLEKPDIPDLDLLRRVGRGSYGEVWIARTLTGVYRAVKVVYRARFEDDRPFLRELDGITRFQRSAGAQARQLALMHVGRDPQDRFFYYVMELADDVSRGTDIDPDTYEPYTLKALREHERQLPAAEAVRLGVELARALAGLHEAGLIHRDVKPSNIIIVGGMPKLADIGLVSSGDHTLTSLGTPGYSPPEGAGTVRADLFSLGRVLYELSTGRGPSEFPRLPSDLARRPDAAVLLELNEIVLRACDPHPENRYSGVEAMLEDLLLVQAGRSVKELAAVRRRLKQLGRVAGIVGLAAVVAFGILGVRHYFALRQLAAAERQARLEAEEQERFAAYTADLQLAQLALAQQDFGIARAALRRRIPANDAPDLRGIEWHALWNESRGTAERVLGTPGGPPVRVLALAPDGLTLAAQEGAGLDRLTVAWDLATGSRRPLADATWGTGGFALDGSRLIVGTSDRSVRTIALEDGIVSETQPVAGRLVQAAGDGRTVLLGENTDTGVRFRVWDAVDQREIALWESEPRAEQVRNSASALGADGRLFAVALFWSEGTVRHYELLVHDLVVDRVLWRSTDVSQVQALRFSPDRTLLAATGAGMPVRIFSVDTGAIAAEFEGHASEVAAAAFSPDGRLLATGGGDQSVRLWDIVGARPLGVLRGHEAEVLDVVWSADGRSVYSASGDGTVREWDASSVPDGAAPTPGFWSRALGDLIFAPGDGDLFVTDADGALARLDPATAETTATLAGVFQPFAFAADDGALLGLTLDRSLVRYRTDTGEVAVGDLRLDDAARIVVAGASDDGSRVALALSGGAIEFWDTGAGTRLRAEATHVGAVQAVAFATTGGEAATGDASGSIHFWDTLTATMRGRAAAGAGVTSLLFLDRGAVVLAGLADGCVVRIDSRSGAVSGHWRAHSAAVTNVRVSPDRSRIVTAGDDGFVRFWTPDDFRPVATLPFANGATDAARASIYRLRFSPDGRRLAALGQDGHLRLWQLEAKVDTPLAR